MDGTGPLAAVSWRPGIGDPTPVGWLTVVAYLLAAAVAARAGRRDRAAGRRPGFWYALAGLMLALGVNKQLDLQTLVTEVGRDVLRGWGEYDRRRGYQLAFIGAVAVGCTALLAAALWLTRRDPGRRWPAAAGAAFVLGFVLVRAASFHHVDAFLGSTVGGAKWNWVLELGGVLLVAAAAWRVRG